jgi:hypothetical protein
MSADNTKLNYLSTWDIDQLVATGTIPVGVGATAVYTFSSPLPSLPVFEVQLQIGDKWYQAGQFATANTLATLQSFYTYINGNQVFINTTVAGTARYFVWSDKVDY